MAEICDEVFAVMEVGTMFPGKGDGIFARSPVMEEYFSHVVKAERDVFDSVDFLAENVRVLPLKMGEASNAPIETFDRAFNSDHYVVFGASYLKGNLCDKLVAHDAVNIHMGVSPFYRGNSTNFWALYDGRAGYVGATIHRLTKGLDSGEILYHVFPKIKPESCSPFHLGMQAVRAAHDSVVHQIKNSTIRSFLPRPQNRGQELRYTKAVDFNDHVAQDFLRTLPSSDEIVRQIQGRDSSLFYDPQFF
jgi:methionyl-tRNA formyltransferase